MNSNSTIPSPSISTIRHASLPAPNRTLPVQLQFAIMPPTLVLIRHAQAQHNATNDWSLPDPPLTELGEQQSRELQESLKASKIGNEVELIVVSAQRRTLQTATIGLDWLIKKGTKGKITTLEHDISRICDVLPNSFLQSSPMQTGKKTQTSPVTLDHPSTRSQRNSPSTTSRS